jgi:hypothetical protein
VVPLPNPSPLPIATLTVGFSHHNDSTS